MRDGGSSWPGGFNHWERGGAVVGPWVWTTSPGPLAVQGARNCLGQPARKGRTRVLRRLCQLGRLGETLADLLEGEERFSVISGASSGDIVGLATSAAAVHVLALHNHGPL